jgi:hypothetical protein
MYDATFWSKTPSMTKIRLNNANMPAAAVRPGPTLIGRGQFGRSLRSSRNPVRARTWQKTYPMFEM